MIFSNPDADANACTKYQYLIMHANSVNLTHLAWLTIVSDKYMPSLAAVIM